ncbi:MAG: hypothetical protein JXB24_01930 [Bacteroidales bacterium]|nr:hypothetical protein [Bacteroidales bacterium]
MVYSPARKEMNNKELIWLCILLLSIVDLDGQDTLSNGSDSLTFKGQLSAYTHFNSSNELPLWLGARYIPQLNYGLYFRTDQILDFEASANIYGNAGLKLNDTSSANGKIKPYRLWVRYSSRQFELRAGLQKINFGSATMLRPLMWFDQIDPRDPLQLTDGVWGILGRYYFLNNANIWLWGLYGNKNPKGWESIKTVRSFPEFGGRFQFPVPRGEAGLSYHYRKADSRDMDSTFTVNAEIPENRIGIDIRLDLAVGCWAEGSWTRKSKNLGIFTNQEILNLGLDYTFGIGNGIYTVFEQLIASSDEKAFAFENAITFSLLSISYPIGLFDNLSAIIYYNWDDNSIYNFINWQKQFDHIVFYVIGYWNPEHYKIPTQSDAENLYAGKGLQLMLVYNH